jgi:hypothetical protein
VSLKSTFILWRIMFSFSWQQVIQTNLHSIAVSNQLTHHPSATSCGRVQVQQLNSSMHNSIRPDSTTYQHVHVCVHTHTHTHKLLTPSISPGWQQICRNRRRRTSMWNAFTSPMLFIFWCRARISSFISYGNDFSINKNFIIHLAINYTSQKYSQ